MVVDRASQDQTQAIAGAERPTVSRSARSMTSPVSATRPLAASGDWVFAIDADERASPELADEIRRVTADPDRSDNGFRVPIRSVILGRSFSYSGTQYDLPLRLFRRDAGRWVGAVHETVALEGRRGTLSQVLQHRTIPDMQTFLRKVNEYDESRSDQFEREDRPYRGTESAPRPFWTFAKLYLGEARVSRRPGEGSSSAPLSGFSVAVRDWKYRERLKMRGAS